MRHSGAIVESDLLQKKRPNSLELGLKEGLLGSTRDGRLKDKETAKALEFVV